MSNEVIIPMINSKVAYFLDQFEGRTPTNSEVRDYYVGEQIEWCRDKANIVGDWHCEAKFDEEEGQHYALFHFEKGKDALMFKMRWSDL